MWSIYIGVATFFVIIRGKIGREIDSEWYRWSELFGYVSFSGVVATTLISSGYLRSFVSRIFVVRCRKAEGPRLTYQSCSSQ